MNISKFYLTLAAAGALAVPAMAEAKPAEAKPEAKSAEVKPAQPVKTEVKSAPPKAETAEASPKIWDSLPAVVATVNGKEVTKQELIDFVKGQFPEGKIPALFTADAVKELAPQMIDSMIRDRLLAADMQARKFEVTPKQAREFLDEELKKLPKGQLDQMTKALAAQGKTMDQHLDAMLKQPQILNQIKRFVFARSVILKDVKTTDAEAKAFYESHLDYFYEPERVKAAHILVKVDKKASEADRKAALEKAKRIAAEVKQDPKRFAEIAKTQSDCPSKENGGELGEFGRKQMVEEFENAVFKMKAGEISDPVKTEFGYHIIRCDAEAKRTLVPFDKVKGELTQMLEAQQMQAAQEKYFADLMAANKVEILVKAPAKAAPAAAPAKDKAAAPAAKAEQPAPAAAPAK